MDAPVEIDTVLVPIDGSDESLEAVEYGVAIAGRYDAVIHVVYVLGDEVNRAIAAGVVDEEEVVAESQAMFETVGDRAAAAAVSMTHSIAYGFSQQRLTVHPGSVILDSAEQIDADFLVIPRESGRQASADVLEKAAEYVLLYASQPVLSV